MSPLDRVLDASPDATIVVDASGTIRRSNPQAGDLFGYRRDELEGTQVERLVPERHRDAHESHRMEYMASPEPRPMGEELDLQAVRKDGSEFPVEISLGPVEVDGEDAVLATVADITDRVRREQRLRREMAFNEVALDSVIDFYWVIDLEGYVTEWSDDGSVTGYTEADAVGTHATDFFPEDERDRIEAAVAELRRTGEVTIEADFRTKDGERVPYSFTGTGLTDEQGETVELCGLAQDVSERKRRERALQRQNERLDEFASVVSHDLRNPMNVAMGHLELAREECDSDALDRVATALDRMDDLVTDVLTLARQGAAAIDAEPVPLADAVETAWRTAGVEPATLRVDDDLGTVVCDGDRLRRLLENLLGNAVDHGGTSVTVRVGALNGADGFYVEDDGPGVPEGDRDAVFDPGYTTGVDGTGFGLAIASRICEAHGWEIDVAPGADDGARFEVTGVEWA